MTTTMTDMPWEAMAQMSAPWEAFARKVGALPRAAEIARKARVGATPTETVHRIDKLRLLRYRGEGEPTFKTPLLVAFALVNRPYILDLRPGKSVVEHFLKRGFDVYNIDWGVPDQGDRHLGMEEYIDGYMVDVVNEVLARHDCDRLNILGYCMGGTMSGIYSALYPETVRNLMLLAAPFDWSSRDSLLSVWTDEKYFDVDRMLEIYGNAPPQWLQSSFLLLKPVQNLVEKYFNFYDNIENEKFLEDFFAMETWLNDNIPVAGEMFRTFVKDCFQRNLLIHGKLRVGGRDVDLRDVTCPVLNLVASNDHLVPCGQSLPFNGAIGSSDRRSITFEAGHIGMAVGSRANRELWPKACEWLAERSD